MKLRIVPVTSYQQNCSIIACESSNAAAFIDPGGEAGKLAAIADAAGLKPSMVLLTHGHLDHVGGAAELAARYAIPVIGPHQADGYWLEMLPQQADMFGFPPAEALQPDRWLEEGEVIELGEEKLEVLHCPGHTPGHVVFYNRAAGLLFSGDVLFKGSIGRSDFPGGDHDQLIASINDKLLVLGNEVKVIPGHGAETSIGEERRGNPFL